MGGVGLWFSPRLLAPGLLDGMAELIGKTEDRYFMRTRKDRYLLAESLLCIFYESAEVIVLPHSDVGCPRLNTSSLEPR